MSKSRNLCFTLNNPSSYELDFSSLSHIRYSCWQVEQGESGTIHLQGYVEMSTPQRFSYLSGVLPGAHFEARRGTRDQARDYCRKLESRIAGPFEYGSWETGGSGSRNDLVALKQRLDDGASEREISDEFFGQYIRYGNGIKRYKILHEKSRDWDMEVTCITGPPGCGKTKWVREQAPEAYWNQGSKWFDGYDGHADVVFDDFYGNVPFHFFLRVLDRYPLMVETKGGQVNFIPKRIWITSNKEPDTWYTQENLDIRALLRRITNRIYMSTTR